MAMIVPRGYQGYWLNNPTTGVPDRREYRWAGGTGPGGGGTGSYSAPDINIPGFGGDGSGGNGAGTGGSGYNLPEYNLPGRDDARIEELRTKALRPAMRGLRNNFQSAMIRGRISDNPFAESHRMGELQAGLGRGYEGAMTAASNTAQSQYAPEYAGQMQKAGAEFGAGVSRAGQMYAGGLQRGNLQYTTQANAAMQTAQMQHQARMAELNASLRGQYPNV